MTEERRVLCDALAEHQRELRRAFEDLKWATRKAGDPRDAIREHPTRWLAGAIVAGFVLGWRR
jgi:hypothetical protein